MNRFKKADAWCREMGLVSERAFSLMFDINVQNGSLFKKNADRGIDVKASITRRILEAKNPNEVERMVIIAEERAGASSPRWVNVVLDRKLAIANGRGKVYGQIVELDNFGITLNPYQLG